MAHGEETPEDFIRDISRMVCDLLKGRRSYVSGIYSEMTGKNYGTYVDPDEDGTRVT